MLELQKVDDRLDRVNQPVQIFLGRDDTSISPCCGEIILTKVCSRVKELTWMEHSGHCILLDNSLDAVTEKVLQFIKKNG